MRQESELTTNDATHAASTHKAAQVFLSGTGKDMSAHRDLVKGKLDKTHFNPLDYREMYRSWTDISKEVENIITNKTDIFLGLFGFRYGEIPPRPPGDAEADSTERPSSITRIELEIAQRLERGRGKPPIIVLTPLHLGKGHACQDCAALRNLALSVAYDDYGDADRAQLDLTDQLNFLRSLTRYAIRWTLRYCSAVDVISATTSTLYSLTLAQEQQALAEVRGREDRHLRQLARVPMKLREMLNQIGYTRQLDQAAEVILALEKQSEDVVPAVALLGFGAPGCGITSFPRALGESDLFAHIDLLGDPISVPDGSTDTPAVIWESLWATLRIVRDSSHAAPDELAIAAAQACRHSNVGIMLDGLEGLHGGVARFVKEVWDPLRAALGRAWRDHAPKGRLILIATVRTSTALSEDDGVCIGTPKSADDAKKLVALDALAGATTKEIEAWLKEVGFNSLDSKRKATEILRDGNDPDAVRQRLMRGSDVKSKLEVLNDYGRI